MRPLRTLAGIAALLAAACGGSTGGGGSSMPKGFYISITNMAFSPVNLDVPPGATVTVVNNDATTHSVTSETAANAFTPGAVSGVTFDTGTFTGQKSFAIPATAAEGTVIPYYCRVHTSTMMPPNGTITVHASAQPGPPPGGSSGGGGGY